MQYWRLVVADNYGDNRTAVLSEVQFFGVGKYSYCSQETISSVLMCVCVCSGSEDGVVSWFDRLEMQRYLKPLVQRVSLTFQLQ